MRSLRGPTFKGLSAITLSLVALLFFALPVMAQAPGETAAQPGATALQFFVVLVAILAGIMILTALLVAFLMWANGSPVPGISPILQDLTAREVDAEGRPTGLSNLGKIGLGLGGVLVVVLVAALAVPQVLSSTAAPQATATPAPVAAADATAPAAAPEPAAPAGPAPEAVAETIQANGCGACHVIPGVEGAAGTVGPSLALVASHAEEVINSAEYQGQATTVEEYIHESIVDPNAYVVPDFPPGVMPQTFGETIPADQLDALVAYLATLQ